MRVLVLLNTVTTLMCLGLSDDVEPFCVASDDKAFPTLVFSVNLHIDVWTRLAGGEAAVHLWLGCLVSWYLRSKVKMP